MFRFQCINLQDKILLGEKYLLIGTKTEKKKTAGKMWLGQADLYLVFVDGREIVFKRKPFPRVQDL